MTSFVSPARRERMRGILDQINDGLDSGQAKIVNVRSAALGGTALDSASVTIRIRMMTPAEIKRQVVA
jgi:hypothetical protein